MIRLLFYIFLEHSLELFADQISKWDLSDIYA